MNNEPGRFIPFIPGDQPRFTRKRLKNQLCKHNGGITVDEQTRTIECDICQAVLDPFEYFLQLAGQEEIVHSNISLLKRTRQDLVVQIEKLQKQLAGLKRKGAKSRT